MKINPNQIYYTVESHYWGKNLNQLHTHELIDGREAYEIYKGLKKRYYEADEFEKAKRLHRLAKVQNGQSITLACCGYGVMDNFSIADNEPIN